MNRKYHSTSQYIIYVVLGKPLKWRHLDLLSFDFDSFIFQLYLYQLIGKQ